MEGEWYNLRDYGAKKGVHFLGLEKLRKMR